MRGWTREARDTRRAKAARTAGKIALVCAEITDEARAEAQRVNAMRFNAATLMLNRAMSEYAEEGTRQ